MQCLQFEESPHLHYGSEEGPDEPAGRTSWTDQLDRPAGQTSYTDLLDGPAGQTSWTDQLDGPVPFI